MEGVQVIKIRYGENLRRYSAPVFPRVTFDNLTSKIRAMFDLPPTLDLSITYTDVDKDEIVMVDDEDLNDALLIQGLNPFRVSVRTPSVSGEVTGYPTLAKSSSMVSTCSQPFQQEVEPPVSHDSGKHVPDLGHAKIQTDMEQHICATLRAAGLSEDAHAPFLHQCPSGIAGIIQTALNSGINVTFETLYEDGDSPVSSSTRSFTTSAQPTLLQTTPQMEASHSSTLASSSSEKTQVEETVEDAIVTCPLPLPAPSPSSVPDKEGEGSSIRAVSVPVTRDGKDLLWSPPETHSGIVCDICDSCPIIGTRYKCLTKVDYDLCPACYVSEGAPSNEYTAIAKPLMRYAAAPPAGPAAPATAAQMPSEKEASLDSRFVRDVTVLDGTLMGPAAVYTKVWRMRNSGTSPWPANTRVMHTGGKRMPMDMADTDSVALKFPSPSGTLPVGQEMDVAVTLRSPPTAGRYLSHWRLVGPDGALFGHRIWAMIQVPHVAPEPSPPPLSTMPAPAAHLKAATAFSSEEKEEEEVEVEAEVGGMVTKLVAFYDQGVGGDGEAGPTAGTAGMDVKSEEGMDRSDVAEIAVCGPVGKEDNMVERAAAAEAGKVEEEKEEVEVVEEEKEATVEEGSDSDAGSDASEGASDAKSDAKSEVEKSCFGEFAVLMHPAVGGCEVGTEGPVPLAASVSRSGEGIEGMGEGEGKGKEVVVEAVMAMGFEGREMIEELAEVHGGNVEEVVRELLVMAEWDPIVAELVEMGFDDVHLNRRVLFNKKGSVKEATKELVRMVVG